MNEAPLLHVESLSTYFQTPRGRLHAVDGVSFKLAHGRTLAIVGESGCGKSVLARTIMGLLPSNAHVAPESRVLFDGRDLRCMSDRSLREVRGRQMAMIFQDPMTSLNPVMTCGAQITEVLEHHLKLGHRAARDRAVELLSSVGIPEPSRRVDHYPHQLSGGMRQRVAIAIALSCEPQVLIADEPTTALDVTVQADILDLLRHQQHRRSMALILITHDLGVVAGRTDEVAVMYAGSIVEHAATALLFTETQMPYTQALLRSIPRLDDPPHTRLEAIGGRPPDLIDPPAGCRFAPRCRYAADDCRRQAPALSGKLHAFACWHPLRSIA